jgi:hypothetical protein
MATNKTILDIFKKKKPSILDMPTLGGGGNGMASPNVSAISSRLAGMTSPKKDEDTLTFKVGEGFESLGIPKEKQAEMKMKAEAKISSLSEKKFKDLSDRLEEFKENPSEAVPFLSSITEGKELFDLWQTAKKIQNNESISQEELINLQSYIDKAEQTPTFGYQVLDSVINMVPFFGELYLTKGVYNVAKAGAIKGTKELLSKFLKKGGKELLEKKLSQLGLKVASSVIAGTAQTIPAGATRIAASTIEKQLQSTLTGDEESVWNSLAKATGEQWVETVSERSGGLLSGLTNPIKGKLVQNGLLKAFIKANPGKDVNAINKVINAMGYNGVIEEMFEERVGDVAHGVLNKIGLSDQEFKIPSLEQLGVELVSFSVPGAAFQVYKSTPLKITPPGGTIEFVGGEDKKKMPRMVSEPQKAPSEAVSSEKGIITPELEPLAQEARKYPTAEEFVAKNTFFRGEDFGKSGNFFTRNKEFAQEFAGIKPLTEVGIPENLIYRPKTLPSATSDFSSVIKEARAKGFRALFISEGKPFGKTVESVFVFDKTAIKTKSQLTDIWNKAQQAETPPVKEEPLISEARKYKSAEEFVKGYEKKTEGLVFDMGKSEDYVGMTGIEKSERAKIRGAFMDFAQKPEYQKLYAEGKINDTQVLTDFYNQVVGGEKESKLLPEAEGIEGLGKDIEERIRTLVPKVKTITQGIRRGEIMTKRQIRDTQTELVDIVKGSGMEAKDKAKFIQTIKNIQTQEQLEKSLPGIQKRITDSLESESKRETQNIIDKELKYTKPVKKGDRRVGKYDYESNKFFEEIRRYNSLNQEEAQNALNQIEAEGLSETDLIRSRFLSLKANGAKSSLDLYNQVLSDIKIMKTAGQKAKDDADFEKILNKEEKVEQVLRGINDQKEAKNVIKWFKGGYISSISNLYSAINAIAGKEMADKYDYGYLQTNSQYAFDSEVEQAKDRAKEIYGLKSDGQLNKKFLKELMPTDYEITDKDGFTQKINGFEIMNIYNGIKNDTIRDRYYNFFGEEQTNSLVQNLSREDIQLADYLMEEVQGYRDVLNQRSIELFGRDLGTVENYWPSKSEYTQDFLDDIRIQGEIPSALKRRSSSSKVVPEMANAWLVFQRHVAQAEHVKTLSGKYEELKNLFSNRKVKKTIQQKYGNDAYNSLMDSIETFSLNRRTQLLDVFSGIYNSALNNWVKAKVASPTVFARQLISSIYSVEEVGLPNYVKYTGDFIKNPRQAFKFMWDNIPFVRSRFKKGYSEALQDVLGGTNSLNIKTSGISKYTTIMSRGGDITAVMLNGYSIIKTELANGKTMQEAIDSFQKFTEKTQQSPSRANLSRLQRNRDAFSRTFFRFKNTTNQLLRLQVDANIQFSNGQITKKQFITKTLLYSIYTPIMYTLMGFAVKEGFKWIFGNDDDDEKEELPGNVLQEMIVQPFQAIPLLDAAAETAYSEARKRITGTDYYLGEGLFSYPLLDDMATVAKEFQEKDISAEEWLKIFSLVQEPITGIPTETILRYYRYTDDKGKTASGGSNNKIKINSKTMPKIQGLKVPLIPRIKLMPKI